MTEHNDDSFKNMNAKEKTVTVIGVSLLIMLITSFVLGIFFFGFAGLFALLGVHYQSIWSLITFVIIFFILGSIVDIFFDVIAKWTVINISRNVTSFLLQVLIGFTSNWIILVIVDAFMEGIFLSLWAKLIIALFLGVLEPVFDDKKAENQKRT